jgi:tetratricopeptide (TPR) repeat protein
MKFVQVTVCAALLGAAGGCASAISGGAENVTRLEQARVEHPASETAVVELGVAYFKADRLADAHAALQQAASMNPSDGVAALYLGLTAEAQNDLPAARAAYEDYLKVGKTRRVRNEITDRLAALKLKEVQLAAKQALARESELAAVPGPPNTVAVLPFQFTGPDTTLQPLERGFAELLVTDLSRSPELTVVERERVQALVDEIALQRQAGVQEGSGVRVGKILRAGKMVSGDIVQQGSQIRASALVTDATTLALSSPATDQRALDQLFTLEQNIVFALFDDLNVRLTTAQRNAIEQRPTRSLAAFLAYSRGLELEDQGRYDDATHFFDNAVRLDPGFGSAQQKAQETRSVAAGTQVNASTVESSLRGTAEGSTVSTATGTPAASATSNAAVAAAGDLNPSAAAGATATGTTTTTTPQKTTATGTGTANVTTQTATITIVIHQPGKS